MTRSIFAALFLLLIGIPPSLAASQGFVVASCPGTLGVNAYTAGQFGNITLDVNGLQCIAGAITTTPAAPAAGTAGAGYPPGATPVAFTATGTSGAVTATLPAASGKNTYICGYNVSAAGTGLITPITITGVLGGTQTVQGLTAGAAPIFPPPYTPCLPSSALNQAISVSTTADATATAVNVNVWGYTQ